MAYQLADLLALMTRLRDPETGCPWDIKQTFETIVPSTIEESYELADAIERGDFDHVREELGDVLFQVVFYSQLGKEQALFDFHQVIDELVTKLVRRHPHVFPDGDIYSEQKPSIDEQQVKQQWEAIKAEERRGKDRHGLLDDVPVNLPATTRAVKLQKRAASVGFDWQTLPPVLDKIAEEQQELAEAMAAEDRQAIEHEFGDVLFSLINLGRQLKIDPETCLRQANQRFEQRFGGMEQHASEQGESLAQRSLESQEQLWQQAKLALVKD